MKGKPVQNVKPVYESRAGAQNAIFGALTLVFILRYHRRAGHEERIQSAALS